MNSRTRRISEEIKKVVSSIIMMDLKDPRISMLTTVTHVETTNDLSFTTIYISVFDPGHSKEQSIKALNSAKGYIRKEIGKRLKLRHTPEPIFKLDESIEHGMHINELISGLDKPKKDENNE